jgi:predicted dehydrogenase
MGGSEKSVKTIHWGIIGCGDVTEVKSGPALQKAHNSELVAVMRRDGSLAEDYARRHEVPKWYDDAEALIQDDDVDAVYIASPPSSHKEYALAVARAGKPAYVEKPMAISYPECQEMIRAFEEAGKPLFTAFYRRALPRFLKVKSIIDDGMIGDVRAVNVRFYQAPSLTDRSSTPNWRTDPRIAGAGYFFDLGSHMIDLLQYFIGPITSVSGSSSNQAGLYDAEDIVSGAFAFGSGVLGTGLWSFAANSSLDATEIVGSHGKVTYSTFLEASVVLEISDRVERFDVPHPEHVQQPLIQLVVDDLLGTRKSPSTGENGAATSWVMDKMLGRL